MTGCSRAEALPSAVWCDDGHFSSRLGSSSLAEELVEVVAKLGCRGEIAGRRECHCHLLCHKVVVLKWELCSR